MASVRKKLREALFFYRHLSDSNVALKPEAEDVAFFLSAFLSAGRSITGFFDEKENRAWFHDWKMGLVEEERKLLNNMVRQRNAEIHEGGADVIPEFHSVQPSGISVRVKHRSFWLGHEQDDVDITCRRYLELLLKLVTAFDHHLSEGDRHH